MWEAKAKTLPTHSPDTPCMPYMPTLKWFWGVNGAAYMAVPWSVWGMGFCVVPPRRRGELHDHGALIRLHSVWQTHRYVSYTP